MRLNTTERYLSVMRESLQRLLMPELRSDDARSCAGVMLMCFDELMRRECSSAPQLQAANEQGVKFLEQMQALLAKNAAGSAVLPAEAEHSRSDERSGFTAEATRFEAINAALAQATHSLASGASTAKTDELLRQVAQWEQQAHAALLRSAPAAAAAAEKKPLSAAQIEAFLRQTEQDESIRVTNLVPISGGYSKQTSRVTIQRKTGTEALILRTMDRSTANITCKAFQLAPETAWLTAMRGAGIPAPNPRWLALDIPEPGRDFAIVDTLSGKVAGTFLQGAEHLSETTVIDIAAQLARLHTLPLKRFSDYIDAFETSAVYTETVEACYRRTLDEWIAYVDSVEHLPSPALVYLLNWLKTNVPKDASRPVPVHGDFALHNLMLEGERLSAVLDWECAMFGAPEQDLAYVRAHISKHMPWERFLQHYLEHGGRAPKPDTFAYYAAFSATRVVIGLNHGTLNLQSGAANDLRIAFHELGFYPEFMRTAIQGTLDYKR